MCNDSARQDGKEDGAPQIEVTLEMILAAVDAELQDFFGVGSIHEGLMSYERDRIARGVVDRVLQGVNKEA